MPYKDKAKQRAYQRQWVRQKRDKGSTSVAVRQVPVTVLEPLIEKSVEQAEEIIRFSTVGGQCKFCGVKVAPIANSCRECSREHYG